MDIHSFASYDLQTTQLGYPKVAKITSQTPEQRERRIFGEVGLLEFSYDLVILRPLHLRPRFFFVHTTSTLRLVCC